MFQEWHPHIFGIFQQPKQEEKTRQQIIEIEQVNLFGSQIYY